MDVNERNALKNNLKELSASGGGSLVKRIIKSKFSESSNVLFIGLGGLGSKTVNQLKKIYTLEFEPTNRVDFLAVDTAEQDLRDITVGSTDGYMELDDEFEIFDNDAIDLLTNPPEEVKGWIGNLKPRPIDNTGAQTTRQIGRIMLCGTKKYLDLRNKISEKIAALKTIDADPRHPTHVVLIAGISGGTGSGTFIDVAYMIRDIFVGYEERNIPTRLWGCFFTPDVQKHVPAVEADPVKWINLRRNGYAALKEIDYFMTNGSEAIGAPVIYDLVAHGGVRVTSSKPIFEEGCAFVVSPNSSLSMTEDIVYATAKSLIYMHQDVSDVQGSSQSILSDYSNVPGHVPTWRSTNVGLSSNLSRPQDPAGIENTDFPAFMNYKYSSFGYNSVYFPRDEMMAYCANLVLGKLVEKWESLNILNQNTVIGFAREYKIATIDDIVANIQSIMRRMGYDPNALKIDRRSDAQYWPKVIGGGVLGKVSDTNNTMSCARAKADEVIQSFSSSEVYNAMVDDFVNAVINTMNSANFMRNYGPFCGIAILTGYGDIKGCCDNFDDMIASMPAAISKNNDNLRAFEQAMQAEATRLESDHNPTAKEIDTFIERCHEYSVAVVENGIYNYFLKAVMKGVKQKLLEYNNETFDIFVPVMETLTEILNADATVFVQSDHRSYAGGQSFAMDAYGILQSQVKRQQFVNVLGGGVNSESDQLMADEFAKSMFNAESRQKWQNYKNNPKELADEIRSVFSKFFTPFVNNLLEKFMILAYNSNSNINLDAAQLDAIWGAADGTPEAAIRDSAISAAAAQIAAQLKNGSSVLTSYENGSGVLEKLMTSRMLMLLEGTPKLNAAIISAMGAPRPDIGYISDECKSVIKSITFTLPVALPLIKNMKDFAQQYYNTSTDAETASGRHLDEKNQNWVDYLPELYGIDAEEYYVETKERNDLKINYPTGRDNLPINHDKNMYKVIAEAVEYGLSKGYINAVIDATGEISGYEILNIISTSDNYSTLFNEYAKMLNEHQGTDWKVALERAAITGSIVYDFMSITCGNASLERRISAEPTTPTSLKNIYRVVRSNMKLTKVVLESREKYSVLFERLSNMKTYTERLDTFTSMLLYGVVTNNEDSKKWTYKYSEDSKERDLFEYTAKRTQLDVVSNIYHTFVKFCLDVNEEMYNTICEYISRLDNSGKRDLAKRDEIVAQIKSVLKDPIFANPVESEKIAYINRLRNESNAEKYRNLYDMPVKYDGKASVHNNIKNFYIELVEKLNDVVD